MFFFNDLLSSPDNRLHPLEASTALVCFFFDAFSQRSLPFRAASRKWFVSRAHPVIFLHLHYALPNRAQIRQRFCLKISGAHLNGSSCVESRLDGGWGSSFLSVLMWFFLLTEHAYSCDIPRVGSWQKHSRPLPVTTLSLSTICISAARICREFKLKLLVELAFITSRMHLL